MQLIQQISMDFAVHGVPPRIFGKQDDSLSRAAQISLYNAGSAWAIPAGAAMMLRYRTASGAIGLYDTLPDGSSPFRVEDNVVTVMLVDQIFSVSGLTECELRIVAEGAGVSTWTFFVEVERGASGDATLPSDYINVFTNIANQVAADAKRAEDAANSVDTTYLMNKTLYDPAGAVEAAGGIPRYVAENAPKVTVENSVSSSNQTNAASAAAVKQAYDLANAAIPSREKGAASGVASLGADGKIPASQLPDAYAGAEELSASVYVYGDNIGSGTANVKSVVKAGAVVFATIYLLFAPSAASTEYTISLAGLPTLVGRGIALISTQYELADGAIPVLYENDQIQSSELISSGTRATFTIKCKSSLSIQKYGIILQLIYATA